MEEMPRAEYVDRAGLPPWLRRGRIHLQCSRPGRYRVDPWVEKIPLEEENGKPLQYSCLENPMDRGAWRAPVQRVTKSRT